MTNRIPLVLPLLLAIPAPAPADDGPEWATLGSPDGTFTVELPGEPRASTRLLRAPAGIMMQTICASGVDGALYSVQRIVIPEPVTAGSEAEALESEQRTFLEEEGRRLVAEEAIDLGGQPGRAFEFVGPPPGGGEGEVTSRSRLYLVDRDVFYVLSVMSALGEPLPEGADRFLGSLAIEPPEARAAAEQRDAEETLRLFLVAAARHDEGALRALALPDEDLAWLLAGEAAPPEAEAGFRAIPIRALRPGDVVEIPTSEGPKPMTVGEDEVSDVRAILQPEGVPIPTRLRRIGGRWRVDAGPIIAGRKAAEAARQREAAGPQEP